MTPSRTALGYARGGSYERLAALASGRTLDLACGERALSPISIDRTSGAIRGDARALPFADACFETVLCHLAFMFFADEIAVAELARVIAPGGRFVAVLGGGPTADGGDALAWLADRQERVASGARITEMRWAQLFAGWDTAPWERCPLELSGSLDEVASTLAAAQDAPFDQHAALRDAFPVDPIPCRAVAWLAVATRR